MHVTNQLQYLNSKRSIPSETYNFALQFFPQNEHENCERCGFVEERKIAILQEHKSLLQPLSSEQTRQR